MIAVAALAPSPASAQAPRASRITVVPISTSTTQTLLGVSFPDPMHGFAVGAEGTILASADGGATWSRQESGIEHIAPTKDPGAPAGTPTLVENNLVGVSFGDARHGHAVGDDHVLATIDGGQTWQSQAVPPVDSIPGVGPGRADDPTRPSRWSFQAVSFVDADHGVIVGPGGTVFSTVDGGRAWSWHGDRRFGYLHDVSFSDPDHGQAVASLPEPGSLFLSLATSDGGRSWQPRTGQFTDLMNSSLKAVVTVDRSRTYVAGGAGRILVTTDDGRHWAAQRRETTETFYGLAFTGQKRGIAAGLTEFSDRNQASLASTDDGGETWASRLVAGGILFDVAFADPSTAVAVGCAVYRGAVEGVVGGCQQSLVLKISFGDPAPAAGGRAAGTGRWLFLGALAAGVVVFGVLLALARRRRPGPSY